ncbi:MAG: AMP-binding protein, partial [Rhodospirillaceae bacterium]|nr:AMP-binding protein [Rhodospirillaceae bacterium]
MHGLMQEIPLMISSLIRYAAEYHGDRQVVSRTVEGPIHRYGYAECERRARRVANVMGRLGIGHGDRVGTLAWNGYRHLELFYGVSGMGAVLHTVNPRLFTEQIVYIINHAEDRVLFVDLTFVELVERIADQLTTVEQVVVMADEDHMPETALPNVLCYETLLAAESEDYAWPLFDERAASSLCYTSGTTGNPKGVLYSHRSTLLHAMAACQNSAMGISAHDVLMPIAPMYHGNAWSLPYLGPLSGAGLALPGTKMDGQSLQELIEGEGVTFALGVPTVFTMLIDHLDESGKRVESLERVAIGGSAVPRAMIERLADPYGVTVHQLWGMTETSPLGTMATATPAIDALTEEERQAVLSQQGRV